LKNQIRPIYLFLIIIFLGSNCASNSKPKKRCANKKAVTSKKIKSQNENQTNEDLKSLINYNTNIIIQLEAKINYLEETLRASPATMEGTNKNDFTIYNKKIILNNGSSLFGNIVYQDDYIIQIETVIGTLTVEKLSVIRVVDHDINVVENKDNMLEINIMQNSTDLSQNKTGQFPNSAQVVLLGEFLESKDTNNNTLLSGEVKNLGDKRADFVKITFTIYKDTQYNSPTAEYTTFVNGSVISFDANITSNASLHPDEVGNFSVIIPNNFGPFLSYSYIIDWEQYE